MLNRKKKMCAGDLSRAGVYYFQSDRVTNAAGKTGTRYIIDGKLTDEQRAYIAGFNNTIISSARHRYAPEIVHPVIIILDKQITA